MRRKVLEPVYSSYDILGFPVIAVDLSGSLVFTNKEFQRLYNAGNFRGIDFHECGNKIFFCSDKGEMKCFSASVSGCGDINLWSFCDVTSFISKKCMLEVATIDEDHITDENLRKVVEKNKRLSDVVELMESGVFIEGTSGSVIQVNNSFLKMLSGSSMDIEKYQFRAESFHRLLAELCSCDDYFLIRNRIISGNSGSAFTDEVQFKDGRIFTRTFFPLKIGSEKKGHLWKFKDITQRRKLESWRTEMEAMLNALESSENVGLYQEYHGVMFANRGLLNLLGTDRETLKKFGIDHFMEKAGDTVFEEDAVNIKRQDGKTCIARQFADTVKSGGSDVTTMTLIDITDKIALSRSLKMNEEKFSNVFYKNTAPMIMFIPDTVQIVDANSAALNFYGYTIEQMRSMKMSDLKKRDKPTIECRDNLDEIVNRNIGARIQARHFKASGEERDVELLMTPIMHDGVMLMFVIIEDISDRLKYQSELESVNSNLKQLVDDETNKRRRNEEVLMEKMRLAEIGEMIGSIAHQWRQPLNTLGLLIQDIMDAKEFDELSDEYLRELVSKGMNQIDYMSRTIDDFRDFFKPTKNAQIFDVKTCVGQVLSIILPQIINNSIECIVYCNCGRGERAELNTEFLPQCPTHNMRVKGFANEFKQVLLNLISNSKDALADKSIRIIKINLVSDDRTVAVQVEDTGGGIPKGLMDRIFDPYFTTKGDKGGTGIGLYMSKAIIEENMKGSLSVENTDDGCRFSISMARYIN